MSFFKNENPRIVEGENDLDRGAENKKKLFVQEGESDEGPYALPDEMTAINAEIISDNSLHGEESMDKIIVDNTDTANDDEEAEEII